MNPTHLTKAKSRTRFLPFRSFSTSHSSLQVESSPVQVEPSPESKTKGKFLPHFFRSFSTSHSSVAQVGPSPESKTKGKLLPHFLRSFSLRSAAGAHVTDARSKGTSKGGYGKAHSLNSSVHSAAFSSDGVLDGSSKDLRCGQGREDDPSKRSRRMHIKNVRSRLVNPLKSMRDSYVECMTAAAGDPRVAGFSMGYQGPCSAQLRAGFPSDSFRPYSAQIGHMELSDERIRAILQNSKSFGEAIPEE